MHAPDVLWACLNPHQDRAVALCFRGHGDLRREGDAPGGRARARGQAGAQRIALRRRVDLRVEVLDKAARFDPEQRLLPTARAAFGKVHGDAHRGPRRAGGCHGVEDPKSAVLHGELEAEAIAEVRRGPRPAVFELARRVGQHLLKRGGALPRVLPGRGGQKVGRAQAHERVLSLGLGQIAARQPRRPAALIHQMRDPGPADPLPDPERHALQDKREPGIVRRALRGPQDTGRRSVPAAHHRVDRGAKLRHRILRKRIVRVLRDQRLGVGHERPKRRRLQIRLRRRT